MKPETAFRTNVVVPFLKTLANGVYFPIQQVAIKGDADIFVCLRGHFIWMELKTDIGKPDTLQKYKASMVRAAGGIDLVVRPSNWKDVKFFLQQLDGGIYDKSSLQGIK